MQHTFFKLLTRPKQASLLAFCLFLLIFSVVAANVLLKQKHANQLIALSLARSQASLLQTSIDKTLSANYALASLVMQEHGRTDWFPVFAASLQKVYPDVASFALSPNGVVQQVYPFKDNEKAIGFNQLTDTKQGLEAWQAKTDNRLTLAGPVDLVQGGKGVVGRLPVYLESSSGVGPVFWGFTNVVVRLDAILGYVNLAAFGQNDFDYRLVKVNEDHETSSAIIASSVEELPDEQVSVDITLPNIIWRLSVSPKHGWLSNWAFFGTIFVLFLASIVLGSLVYLALRARQGKANLESIIEQRTHQLTSSNKRMSAIFAAIPDSFYEVSEEGVVVAYHSPRMDALYQKVDWPIGKHFSELLHQEAVPIVEQAMAEAKAYGYSSGYEYFFDFGSDRRWFEISGTYSTDENRKTGFYILLSREVTHRKEVESELRIAATAFQTQDGILISDKENKIIRVNSAFEKITGYKEFEVIGHTPNIISSGRHPKSFYRDMFQHLKDHESWEGEIWNRRKNGEIFPEWLSISIVKDEHGALTHYVATFKDISEDKANERRINQLNYYDTLTRLPNRRMVTEDIDHMLSNIDLRNRRSAILFIDLDHFKDVNDVKGHHLGDMLLQQVASRLMDATRSGDTVARFSGDEFIVVLEDVDISLNPDRIAYRAKHVASKIMTALGQPFELDSHPYTMTASIGIAILGEDVISSDDIIKHAEMAMYEAKGEGRNRVCFYAPQMHERILERVTFDNSFRSALQNNEFTLYYQPQWNAERTMVGVEALVRWFHPSKGMISPSVFIPFAEESKLILPLGRWVMESAMRQLAQWQKSGTYPNLVMSINVSVMQFSHEEFVAIVEDSLAITGVNPAFIQLELTESMLVRDQLDIIQKMQALKRLGVLISLDDFGTGYSSLSYLQQLPIDQLKIDQSFTRAIEESDKQASLAATIIGLGHNLGMEVIAEGVETEAQFAWLKEHGCDLYQGFLLGRPQPVSELEKTSNFGV